MYIQKPLLTVVVPVYNVEKYLRDCLDSLLNQTIIDHKIIVVNDGTKDSSGEIAKAYAAKYPDMIRFVEQENQGLGAARNTGLALVDTEYVAFLDSDDWWDCHFMEKLHYQLAHQDERPDLIFTLPWIYDDVTKRVLAWYDKPIFDVLFFPHVRGAQSAVSRVVNVQMDRRLYELEPNACRRIYRMQFVREEGFQFPVGVKWEDVQPHFYLIHKAKRCVGIRSTGFMYRINTGGQITAGGGASRLDMISVYSNTLKMAFAANYPKEEVAYIIRMLCSFSKWSIDVTNTDYIKLLLNGLHRVFLSIPKDYFKVYFNLCSPSRKKDMVLTAIIRSSFYNILADYRIRQLGERVKLRFWHIRNKVRRK